MRLIKNNSGRLGNMKCDRVHCSYNIDGECRKDMNYNIRRIKCLYTAMDDICRRRKTNKLNRYCTECGCVFNRHDICYHPTVIDYFFYL